MGSDHFEESLVSFFRRVIQTQADVTIDLALTDDKSPCHSLAVNQSVGDREILEIRGAELYVDGKPPPKGGPKTNHKLLLRTSSHYTALALMSINRNQERISIRIGKLVSLHIGAVIKRSV